MGSTNLINNNMEYRLTNIAENLWHRFKILCVTQKKSLREKLLEMIQHEVDEFFKGKS